MMATLIEFAWYAALALIVSVALVGLARHQLYLYRVNRRVRRLSKIRRNR